MSGILIKRFSPFLYFFLRRLMGPFRAGQKHMEVCREFGRGIFNIIHRGLLIHPTGMCLALQGSQGSFLCEFAAEGKIKIKTLRPSSTYLLSFLSTFIFFGGLWFFFEEQSSVKLLFVTWHLRASLILLRSLSNDFLFFFPP